MKALRTASGPRVTEHQKAWGRLALLTVVGLVCPPLAAAKSGAVWGLYLLLVVLYSLWTIRVTRVVSRDGQLGYLLCVADAAVLVPIMVWSLHVAMPLVLMGLWALGVTTSWRSARARRLKASTVAAPRARSESRVPPERDELGASVDGAPLERALRVRLRVLDSEGTRFGLVVLKLAGYEAMIVESGKEATREFLQEASHRGMRLLGADAQVFPLPGGRVAFVFATDSALPHGDPSDIGESERIDPHDTESLAMALAARVCEKTLRGHRLECVVGWASAPADGTTVDDLMYAAESGTLSTAAFRRVRGSRVAVPEQEKKHAVAG